MGPPGTGKTDVAVQIISNIYHNFPEQRTLLVTHSNQVRLTQHNRTKCCKKNIYIYFLHILYIFEFLKFNFDIFNFSLHVIRHPAVVLFLDHSREMDCKIMQIASPLAICNARLKLWGRKRVLTV